MGWSSNSQYLRSDTHQCRTVGWATTLLICPEKIISCFGGDVVDFLYVKDNRRRVKMTFRCIVLLGKSSDVWFVGGRRDVKVGS